MFKFFLVWYKIDCPVSVWWKWNPNQHDSKINFTLILSKLKKNNFIPSSFKTRSRPRPLSWKVKIDINYNSILSIF